MTPVNKFVTEIGASETLDSFTQGKPDSALTLPIARPDSNMITVLQIA
jgi:hypothetical protein